MNSPSPPKVPNSPPLAGERLAFTGTLASMTHKEAHARVEECGGTATEHVSRQTTMLVVGEEGWPLEADGTPSVKFQHAERLRQEGLDLRIVSESEWLGFVGLDGRRDQLHRRCTPAMLSKMLNVSVHDIRRWERMGLIKAVSHVHRLPYFDFQEVAGARRLVELVEAGVPVREIQSSLERLQSVVGVGQRPLAQLELLAAGRHVLYRDERGHLKTAGGQRLFDFAAPEPKEVPPGSSAQPGEADQDCSSSGVLRLKAELEQEVRKHWTAQEWFEEGRRLADEGLLAPAVEALRMSLMEDADGPEVQFHLAEALYRQGNLPAALERFHVAAELDHNYLEAWIQIGCIHAELGNREAATEAFDIALDLHPDCPDAHIHKAETLHQAGRTHEAIPHWRKYLEFDRSGPWAEAARTRLEAHAGEPGERDERGKSGEPGA
jgi:tetratricopeptide (TPR) repeat protein